MEKNNSAYPQFMKIAFRNVIRNWRHSLATLFSISCGFVAISLFDGYLKDLKDRINDGFATRAMMGHVIIQKKDAQDKKGEDEWQYSLGKDDQKFLEEFLKNDPDVAFRIRFLNISGILNSGSNNPYFIGYGYDIADGLEVRGSRWAWNALAGLPLHLAKMPSVAIGGGLGQSIDCEFHYIGKLTLEDGNFMPEERPFSCPHNRVTLSVTTEFSQVNAMDFPIIGFINAVFADADKHMVHLSLQDAQKLMDTEKISMVTVLLKSDDVIDSFIERARHAAEAKDVKLDIARGSTHKLASYLQGGLQILAVFRNMFMVVLIIIGVMSVVN
ncbi:MAG: hypothetical protein HQK54_11745, partial [Oligoflexales bacterium]|nr:hypothetical protein [Oligoflexales bacterium]